MYVYVHVFSTFLSLMLAPVHSRITNIIISCMSVEKNYVM